MRKDSVWLGLAAFFAGGLGGIIVVLLGVFWGEKAILGFIAVLLWDFLVIKLMTSTRS